MPKKILDVPLIEQLPHYCGPACLSMVFHYLGYGFTQETIASWWDLENKSIKKEKGVDRHDLVLCAEEFGFTASEHYSLGLDGIIKTIDSELPLIARIGPPLADQTHLLVVKGYQTNPDILWINDSARLNFKRVLYENFEREWSIKGEKGSHQYGLIIRGGI